MSSVLSLVNVKKSFWQAKSEIAVLNGINLNVERGEIVALVGPSGSGKTTLLQIAGLLAGPDSGDILVNGQNLSKSSDKERTLARRKNIGFVYQFHHLLPEFNALENIIIPQLINGVDKKVATKIAEELLEKMDLKNRAIHRPGELSGGQQQRVAIARALANNPALLLADEPTGNLDSHTAEQVFNILKKNVQNCGALIATHNPELMNKMDRVIRIADGSVS